MKTDALNGPAIGFLAGTTFGSGLAFLLGWQAYQVVSSVSIFGVAGVLLGVIAGQRIRRRKMGVS